MNSIRARLRHLLSSLCRWEEKEGIRYLVAPTVLMTEGVHNGIFYPEKELSKFPEAWNGRPVVVGHPKDWQGKDKSAGDPDVMTFEEIGRIFNCRWVGGDLALKGEAWIEEKKALELAPEALTALLNDINMDVSTGLFVEEDGEPGSFKGKAFESTAYNYRPDHLALLPGGKGACSWEDGAGIPRINRRMGILVNHSKAPTSNEISQDELRMKLAEVVRISTDKVAFIVDIFQTWFIYEQWSDAREANLLYRQEYRITQDDQCDLVGERMEVRVEVNYVPVLETNASLSDPGEKAEAGRKSTKGRQGDATLMTKKQLVNAVIANEASGFTEDDRETLMSLEETELLEKILDRGEDDPPAPLSLEEVLSQEGPKDESESVKAARIAFQKALNPEDPPDPEEESPVTFESLLANAGEELKESLEHGQELYRSRRKALTEKVLKTKTNEFSAEDLEGMSFKLLEKTASLLGRPDPNMLGRGTGGEGVPSTLEDDRPDEMPEIEWTPGS